MATAFEDLNADDKLTWLRKHLYNIEGGFKDTLSDDEIIKMLRKISNIRSAQMLGMA